MKRTPMWATLIVALAALWTLVLPLPTVAAQSFHYDAQWDGFIDDRCGTSDQVFKVDAYEDADYEGAHTRLCGPIRDLCNAPLYDIHACSLVWGNNGLNDRLSSYKVHKYPAGRCIAWYENADYDTLLIATTASDNWVGAYANDKASSIRVGC